VANDKDKILIIDDDHSMCKTLGDIIKAKGYLPVIVYDGTNAIEEVGRNDISAAIIDLKLPNEHGIQILKSLKEISPETEAIILTAYASLPTAIQAIDYGAFGYLEKPYNVDQLMVTLERALERRHLLQERKRLMEEREKAYLSLREVYHGVRACLEAKKEVLSKQSVSGAINKVYDITHSMFKCHPFFFILNASKTNLTSIAQVHPNLFEHLKVAKASDISPLIQWLSTIKAITLFESHSEPPRPLVPFMARYPSWYAIPLVAESECIGCFVAAFTQPRVLSPMDKNFLVELVSEMGGPIRQTVLFEEQIDDLKDCIAGRTTYFGLVGKSKPMQQIYDLIKDVSATNTTILITGENGTGKELVARAIHKNSPRKNGPFIVANCSAYPQTLLESELFGHEKGAFTGAIRQKRGRFELAHGGTLFLDEIGEIPPATQVMLLRVLQDHEFERVGGEKTIKADVRIVAATNRDLRKEMKAGRFRDDLYYRLNVISIHLPPLRERKEDIPLLCNHFLKKFSIRDGKDIKRFSTKAMKLLLEHDWPGNVRELQNTVEYAVTLAKGKTIKEDLLPVAIRKTSKEPTSLADYEKRLISKVLKECNWNKHQAARRLDISRATLYSKIRRYGLNP